MKYVTKDDIECLLHIECFYVNEVFPQFKHISNLTFECVKCLDDNDEDLKYIYKFKYFLGKKTITKEIKIGVYCFYGSLSISKVNDHDPLIPQFRRGLFHLYLGLTK